MTKVTTYDEFMNASSILRALGIYLYLNARLSKCIEK